MKNTMNNAERAEQRNLTRRRFLAQAGASAFALSLAESGRSETPQPKIILGEGSHKYECVHDWLVPPDGLLWGDTQGVAQDAKGRIYISHTVHPQSKSGDAIVVFDKNGKFVTSWGKRFRGGGHGLDIRKENGKEYLYHCDTAHRVVVKTDLDGKVVWEKGVPTEAGVYSPDVNFIPTNVALAPNGDFYIADGYGSGWITQYNLKGEFIRVFGGNGGAAPGKVNCPHGIRVDTRGKEPLLVVADRENHRLQYFSLDGKPVRMNTDGMRRPCHFDIRGDLLLVPDLVSVVTILDKNNKVVAQLGDGANVPDLRGHPRSEYIPGKFIHPHSAKFLHNGDILVVEWVEIGRVTLLKKLS